MPGGVRAPVKEIDGPAGRLEVILEEPDAGDPSAAVVFGHPHPQHGGTMHTKVVFRASKALASLGCAVLRFNFRGVGRSEGSFGNGHGEIEDFRAAMDFMADRFPSAPLWAAGMSFGAYVSLNAGATDDRVDTLLGLAPALRMYDFSAVRVSTKRKYFIQGEKDEVCPLPDMQAFFESLPEPKQLAVIPEAKHLFVEQLDEVGEAIRTFFADWQGQHA
jgi:alpha/beta superfamily hydrolase